MHGLGSSLMGVMCSPNNVWYGRDSKKSTLKAHIHGGMLALGVIQSRPKTELAHHINTKIERTTTKVVRGRKASQTKQEPRR